ncbi:Splicing factor 3A subunit 1 [Monocercomonoides exilis]|uniref:Splicing factor 3A subunit 1 n=1 Tax=Monocercomonoides exilis TaxID=2049356 RepID=UPI00355A9FF9|nr:Splicing factor 3A subunit 1 [Monocercomonoides exilis]|eukprot:MONOS_16829.1-p1 / transcript=MONOS_16829.1 / gene=MONOS_16829 / organism=Monocercomonoides_exilis_PA203 / gene_product=Splicing factor 3A subunit 1 / transcript_product=Splicing factor 3A subunit 1 / location=Mono_scaffold00049:159816-162009(-) / protein_length=552 / sequence_SO=supercontig / SO=protein_coding / is_pseudo=false
MTNTPIGKFILPPTEVQTLIEKTAQFIAEKGASFEQKLLDDQKDNHRFEFLKPESQYHQFYAHTLHQKIVEGAYKKAGLESEIVKKDKQKEKKTSHTVERAAQIRKIPKEAPPPFRFAVDPPNQITTLELEQIKLTALFAAKNGMQFIQSLPENVKASPQFEFLQPSSTRYFYYQSLIQQYEMCLRPSPECLKKIDLEADSKFAIFKRIQKRAAWERWAEETKQRDALAAEAERDNEAAQIDWHDFVVVERVVFDDDEDEDKDRQKENSGLLNLGASTDDHNAHIDFLASSLGGASIEGPTFQLGHGRDESEDVDMDMDIEENDEQHQTTSTSHPHTATSSSSSSSSSSASSTSASSAANATPLSRAHTLAAAAAASLRMVVCSFCGKEIPESEIDQHIKMEMSDSTARQKRIQAMNKTKALSASTGDEIAISLQRFAERRPDIFSSTGKESAEEKAAREAKLAEERRIALQREAGAWDGRFASKATASSIAQYLPQSSSFTPDKQFGPQMDEQQQYMQEPQKRLFGDGIHQNGMNPQFSNLNMSKRTRTE